MMVIAGLRKKIDAFPPEVKTFLLRSFVLFVIWKSIYIFYLGYERILDKPLTNIVGAHTAWVLNAFSAEKIFSSRELISIREFEGQYQVAPVSLVEKSGKKLLGIADGCNGLELFILYIGFIIAMPAVLKRKALFLIVGAIFNPSREYFALCRSLCACYQCQCSF
ncbi:MAG: hypothetical protein FJX94_06035 [Bacteroidetes bacterium]|nr:hypothetical protein [Bacteroidota bacterium]